MDKHSLSHASWECIYHIVWIPKFMRRVLCGEARREVGEMLRTLVDHMDGVEIAEGAACADLIHVCLRMALRHRTGNVVGRPRGKSAILLYERHPELRRV